MRVLASVIRAVVRWGASPIGSWCVLWGVLTRSDHLGCLTRIAVKAVTERWFWMSVQDVC